LSDNTKPIWAWMGKMPTDYYVQVRGFCASLECEMEQLRSCQVNYTNFWKKDNDGSLRNNGVEFMSLKGVERKTLVEAFTELHKGLVFYTKGDPFHERTSTHVHVNVQTLTPPQVKNMLLLYALFEEFFFAMVKPHRRDNIHCVPLTETYLPNNYHRDLEGLIENWHKYTALNLKRITDLGTVEFRHLHGTNDAKELDVWLHVLENLWKLCQRIEIDEKSLSNKAQIQEWFELVFFPADKIMMLKPSLFDIIRNSLIDVKFSTLH
jgi:hypothetical protein